MYYQLLNENLVFNQMLFIISMTQVFEQYKFKSGDEARRFFELGNSNFGEDCPKPPEKTKTGRVVVQRGS